MFQLHLHVVDGPQPEVLLSAATRREVYSRYAETTAVNAYSLGDTRINIDTAVQPSNVQGLLACLVFVNSQGCLAVVMGMQLAEYARHICVIAHQQVAAD